MATGYLRVLDEKTKQQIKDISTINGLNTGNAATTKAGWPNEFFNQVQKQQQILGTLYVARAGNRPRYEFDISPKAGNNLSKSSTNFATRGFLPADAKLGRKNNDGSLTGHHKKDALGLILREYPPKFTGNETNAQAQEMLLAAENKIFEKFSYLPALQKNPGDDTRPNLNTLIKDNLFSKDKNFDISVLLTDRSQATRDNLESKIQSKQQALTDVPFTLHQLLEGIKSGEVVNTRLDSNTGVLSFKQSSEGINFQIDTKQLYKNQPKFSVKELKPEALPQTKIPNNLKELTQGINNKQFKDAVYDKESKLLRIKLQAGTSDAYSVVISGMEMSSIPNNINLGNVKPNTPGDIDAQTYDMIQQQLAQSIDGDMAYTLFQENGEKVQCFANTENGAPVSGDIDGLLAGAPKDLDPEYSKEYNTFAGAEQQMYLNEKVESLYQEYKNNLDDKEPSNFNGMEKMLAKYESAAELYTDEQLSRGGCISAFQFLTMQIQNKAYADNNHFYGDEQTVTPSVTNLFQHGYDMHNPYGCNAEGAALVILPEMEPIYAESQEQLCKILCSGNLLEENKFEVNYGCDMEKGWGDVVRKQIAIQENDPKNANNAIPQKTLESFYKYEIENLAQQAKENEGKLSQKGEQKLKNLVEKKNTLPPNSQDILTKFNESLAKGKIKRNSPGQTDAQQTIQQSQVSNLISRFNTATNNTTKSSSTEHDNKQEPLQENNSNDRNKKEPQPKPVNSEPQQKAGQKRKHFHAFTQYKDQDKSDTQKPKQEQEQEKTTRPKK